MPKDPELHISSSLSLPLEVVTSTLAILAIKRAGKSNAAVVMAEEMYDAGVPWVAIDPKGDWWGVRAAGSGNSPGLSVLVFGGLHGDVPLEPTSGKLVASLIVDQRITCVLDVSEMTKADQRRFLIDFATHLYKTNREPLHVFCEEADEYIPQRVMGENAKLVGAFETLVKRGGFRGIGITLITQRSASLNKDVLTQIETLIPMRTPSPQDRKAVLGWVEYHNSGKEVVDQLPSLTNGEAYVFSPQFLDQQLVRIKFRKRRTFDSGATPEIGKKVRPPARLAEVDLDSIKVAMAETIEKAEAEDPKVLKRKVADLEKRLAAAEKTKVEPEVVEVPVIPESVLLGLKRTEEQMRSQLQAIEGEVRRATEEIVSMLTEALKVEGEKVTSSSAVTRAGVDLSPPPLVIRQAPRSTPPAAVDGNFKLGKAERKVLSVLAQHGPRTHDQMALLTGYSRKASTLSVVLGKLRKAGLVEQGQPITATQAGLDAIEGHYEPLPTGADLVDFWRNQFGGTERNVLDAFLHLYPNGGSQQEIAEITGYSPQASTISVALGKLRRVGVVDKWRISEDFAREAGL